MASNSQGKSEQNAQKVTRELAQRTRLPTLGSQINRDSLFSHGQIKKDEDKPMESYANVKEVLIYLTSVMLVRAIWTNLIAVNIGIA